MKRQLRIFGMMAVMVGWVAAIVGFIKGLVWLADHYPSTPFVAGGVVAFIWLYAIANFLVDE